MPIIWTEELLSCDVSTKNVNLFKVFSVIQKILIYYLCVFYRRLLLSFLKIIYVVFINIQVIIVYFPL